MLNMSINETNLHKMFRDFYTLTGIKVVFLDKDGNMIMRYPKSLSTSFCHMISQNNHWKKRCKDCDRTNVESCRKSEKTVKYFCHLGLSEAITPVYDNSGLLGYVTFGQILTEDNAAETKKRLKAQFDENEFPGIGEAIDNIPVKTAEQLDASVTVLEAITAYMLSNRWVTPRRSGFIRHMDMFIENNLEKNITVDDICNEFHLRRTHLYAIARDYLGCSIAQYIRRQRISHACRMLCETDDSISQIAYKSGFSDYGHFSRIFRRIQGVSASNYRMQYRTKNK